MARANNSVCTHSKAAMQSSRNDSRSSKSASFISNRAGLPPFEMSRVFGFFLLISLVSAQTNPASITARHWRETHERAIIEVYFQLLSIPNIATDQVNIRRNADLIVAMLKKRGVDANLVEAPRCESGWFSARSGFRARHELLCFMGALRRSTARSQRVGIAAVFAGTSAGWRR